MKKEKDGGKKIVTIPAENKVVIENVMVKKSKERIDKLTQKIFSAINETADECEGDFTIYEIQDVLLRISHSYNKRFLTELHKSFESTQGE